MKAAQALAARHGRAISAAVATEVEQTLRAATADPGAAAAVQSGCLLRALSADGVDVVDLAGAVAVPGSHAASVPGTGAALEPRLERPASTGQHQRPPPAGQNRRTGPHSAAELPVESRQRNSPASGPSGRHG